MIVPRCAGKMTATRCTIAAGDYDSSLPGAPGPYQAAGRRGERSADGVERVAEALPVGASGRRSVQGVQSRGGIEAERVSLLARANEATPKPGTVRIRQTADI